MTQPLPSFLSARVDAACAKLALAKNSYETTLARHEVEAIRDEVARYAGNEAATAVFKSAKPQQAPQFLKM